MIRKRIWLFLLMCGINGIMTVLGSILGNAFKNPGLFVGAIIGGIGGITLVGIMARRFELIDDKSQLSTIIGATLGYVAAAVIAINNLHTPVIPVLSESLVGIGAIVGSFSRKEEN